MSKLAQHLGDLLGDRGWLTRSDAAGFQRDWLNRFGEEPLGVARPKSTSEVAAIVAACCKAGVPVTPQGGNTSLCGASVGGEPGHVILSLARMNQIGPPDKTDGLVTVEAGVVLEALHRRLDQDGLVFPLHLGAEGSAQIGGLIATNAGGSQALRYGMMQDLVVGLEVVLADGSIWNGLRRVQKDNAGYQLRRLFCGSEGTLGVVTRAVLKLFPAPQARATALLGVSDCDALVALGARLRAEAGEFISGLEFFCETGLALLERNVDGVESILETRAPWYLVVEMSTGSPHVPLDDILESVLTEGLDAGWVLDGTIAGSEAQRQSIWRLRDEQPEGQRLEGAQLKHDISVPVSRIAEFVDQADKLCQGILPGVRSNPFGHLGDGNIHYNLSPPEQGSGFGDLAQRFAADIGQLATEFQGSFAAEHGLGRAKISLADTLRAPVERELMARLKSAFDPHAVLNPGVIVSPEHPPKLTG